MCLVLSRIIITLMKKKKRNLPTFFALEKSPSKLLFGNGNYWCEERGRCWLVPPYSPAPRQVCACVCVCVSGCTGVYGGDGACMYESNNAKPTLSIDLHESRWRRAREREREGKKKEGSVWKGLVDLGKKLPKFSTKGWMSTLPTHLFPFSSLITTYFQLAGHISAPTI